jgi:hypothetical protein
MDVPADVYEYLFSLAKFRLHDIINLTTISKKIRMISLKGDHWHIISDTKTILYNFVRYVIKSGSNTYPCHHIQKMCAIDQYDIFHCQNLLPITLRNINEFKKFYKRFADYRYLYLVPYVNFPSIKNLNSAFRGIYISPPNIKICEMAALNSILKLISRHYHDIKELTIPNGYNTNLNCILEWYPLIEKITAVGLGQIIQLKNLKLKYLCITDSIEIDALIPYLCDTIESLIMMKCGYTASLFNQLIKFQYLTYIKINFEKSVFSTILHIDTVHLVTTSYDESTINMPHVRNIIITPCDITRSIRKLHLESQNAITCQLTNVVVSHSTLFLPNCPEIIILNGNRKKENTDIFRPVK